MGGVGEVYGSAQISVVEIYHGPMLPGVGGGVKFPEKSCYVTLNGPLKTCASVQKFEISEVCCQHQCCRLTHIMSTMSSFRKL